MPKKMPSKSRVETFKAEWERRTRALLEPIYDDPDLAKLVSPEEVKKDLCEMGVDPQGVSQMWKDVLAATQGLNHV